MSLAMGEAHRRYTAFVNERQGWTGHLFQARFASVVMDENHLMAAVRYVTMNPVRAGLVDRAEDWPWSSARAHLNGRDDGLVTVGAVLERVPRFADLLEPEAANDPAFAAIRKAETTGRPLGAPEFVLSLERRLDRKLARRKPGPPPKTGSSAQTELWR